MKRVEQIDFIRALAILGVFLVNAPTMNQPYWFTDKTFLFQNGTVDSWLTSFAHMFLVHKIYPLLALLFGVSLKLMHERGVPYIRRMFIFMLLGVLQAYLVFWGDILFLYGVMGLGIFILSQFSLMYQKALLVAISLLTILLRLVLHIYPVLEFNNESTLITDFLHGSFLSISTMRGLHFYYWNFWGFFQGSWQYISLYGASFLELFTYIGWGYFLKTEILRFIAAPFEIRWHRLIFLILGICGVILTIYAPYIKFIKSALFIYLYMYLALVLFDFVSENIKVFISQIGRTSLSHYLVFNILCSLLLYGYGLSYYGKIGPSMLMLFAIGNFIVLGIAAHFWLKVKKRGPFEAVLRVLDSN